MSNLTDEWTTTGWSRLGSLTYSSIINYVTHTLKNALTDIHTHLICKIKNLMKANFSAKYSPNSWETEWQNVPFCTYNIYLHGTLRKRKSSQEQYHFYKTENKQTNENETKRNETCNVTYISGTINQEIFVISYIQTKTPKTSFYKNNNHLRE